MLYWHCGRNPTEAMPHLFPTPPSTPTGRRFFCSFILQEIVVSYILKRVLCRKRVIDIMECCAVNPRGVQKRERFGFLDTIRGLVLLSMIGYHAVWDAVNLLGLSEISMNSFWVLLWQRSICWVFILLSGFCWQLGKRPFHRGITVLGTGMLVTLVTVMFLPSQRIIFGILTLLGSCMLLMIPLEKVLRKIPALAGLVFSLCCYFFTANIAEGYLGFGRWIPLPGSWYHGCLGAYLGFLPKEFFSTDYYPLFPWLFLFIAGYFLYRLAMDSSLWKNIRGLSHPVLSFLGRHSLLVYLLHQPLLFGMIQLMLLL